MKYLMRNKIYNVKEENEFSIGLKLENNYQKVQQGYYRHTTMHPKTKGRCNVI